MCIKIEYLKGRFLIMVLQFVCKSFDIHLSIASTAFGRRRRRNSIYDSFSKFIYSAIFIRLGIVFIPCNSKKRIWSFQWMIERFTSFPFTWFRYIVTNLRYCNSGDLFFGLMRFLKLRFSNWMTTSENAQRFKNIISCCWWKRYHCKKSTAVNESFSFKVFC